MHEKQCASDQLAHQKRSPVSEKSMLTQSFGESLAHLQGSKIALVRSYLRVPQAAGQVKILIFLVKINFFP